MAETEILGAGEIEGGWGGGGWGRGWVGGWVGEACRGTMEVIPIATLSPPERLQTLSSGLRHESAGKRCLECGMTPALSWAAVRVSLTFP